MFVSITLGDLTEISHVLLGEALARAKGRSSQSLHRCLDRGSDLALAPVQGAIYVPVGGASTRLAHDLALALGARGKPFHYAPQSLGLGFKGERVCVPDLGQHYPGGAHELTLAQASGGPAVHYCGIVDPVGVFSQLHLEDADGLARVFFPKAYEKPHASMPLLVSLEMPAWVRDGKFSVESADQTAGAPSWCRRIAAVGQVLDPSAPTFERLLKQRYGIGTKISHPRHAHSLATHPNAL